jgi:L-seryl-tRNA(Ser) seleniumtransferase
VSAGAAAGLVLAAAACMAGSDQALFEKLPNGPAIKNEIILHHSHRNGYDYALRQAGAKLVEIGGEARTTHFDLEQAIGPATAAVFWFQGAMTTGRDLPLAEVIRIAQAHNLPVVVDAAAQLPPVSNLWHFTQIGAALAIFSGGKDLRGPQSSGLVLGRKDLVEACRRQGNPNPFIGRPMKVGKEEMLGLLAAVERYLALDHAAREQYCEDTVRAWCAALNAIPGLAAERSYPNEAGQPLPRCRVSLAAGTASITRDALVGELLAGDPAIVVEPYREHEIHLNPMTLAPGEEAIVLTRLREILAASRCG